MTYEQILADPALRVFAEALSGGLLLGLLLALFQGGRG
jgi:hypothetical protein